MIKPLHHLTRLIVPVFLFQALNLQAQTTRPPTTSPPQPVSCNSLTGQTAGVERQLKQYRDLVRGRQCVVFSADPTENLNKLIERIPENTVILLSSHTTIPPKAPGSGNTPINYFISSAIVLQDGQDIIGAPDDGFDIIITNRKDRVIHTMVKVGSDKSFQFSETRDSHIKHITFLPTGPKYKSSVNVTISAECFSRRLIVEDNVFYVPFVSAVYLNCVAPLYTNSVNAGPGLRFANNTLGGVIIPSWAGSSIPEKGIYINLPFINNLSQRLAVIGNTFLGKIAAAGEFILGPGSRLDVFRNKVNISNIGITFRNLVAAGQSLRGGFALSGPAYSGRPPLFNLAGNQIQVTATAIIVSARLELALACNHLQAVSPWQQLRPQFRLIAGDPSSLTDECNRLMSSSVVIPTPDATAIMPTLNSTAVMPSPNATVVMSTPNPYPISRIVNTWTAMNGSTATACSGLFNVERQFLFDSEVCHAVAAPSNFMITNTPPGISTTYDTVTTYNDVAANSNVKTYDNVATYNRSLITPTSSAGASAVTTGLGVITTLATLLSHNY